MSESTQVWDLGEIDTSETAVRPVASIAGAGAARGRNGATARPSSRRTSRGVDWVPALSVPLPGAASILRGRTQEGMLIASGLGLMAALAWAFADSVDRVAGTLTWLGLPPAAAVWALFGFAAGACVLHVAAVALSRPEGFGAPPPVVSAFASAIAPGWGQVINGDAVRGAFFLLCAWVVVALWVLSSPGVEALLASRSLVLPDALAPVVAAPARFAATAAVWAVAVHDAGMRARWIRD